MDNDVADDVDEMCLVIDVSCVDWMMRLMSMPVTTITMPPSGHTHGAIDTLVCARIHALPQRQRAARVLHRGRLQRL
jgi:hypothetical protein